MRLVSYSEDFRILNYMCEVGEPRTAKRGVHVADAETSERGSGPLSATMNLVIRLIHCPVSG